MPSISPPDCEMSPSEFATNEKQSAAGRSNLPRRNWFRLIGIPAIFVILGVAAMAVDMPLSRWFHDKNLPDGLKKLCDLSEVFGHGLGVAAILITAAVLSPQLLPRLPRVIAGAYLSGAAALSMKLLVARTRPNRAFIESIDNVQSTFKGFFPWFSTGFPLQSFPSGHTATAIGLALGLSWLFPRGKWLFSFFVFLVAAQRIVGGYHFLSDTLWAAALGWICASACLPGGWLSPPFDRLESQLNAGAAADR